MAIAIALVVLLAGSIIFHFMSPWQLTELASNWGSIDNTINISFVVTGLVFAAVNLFMAYAIIRYRYKNNTRSQYEPENKKLELWLTVVTTLGIAALLAPGLFVWSSFVDVPSNAHRVEVVGQQWHWSFRYPGEDGKFGAVDTGAISPENPFGMDPDDPNGQDDVLVRRPKLVLPLDQPVEALLRSKDVIHNFQVAQFRVKMDLVPGQVSYIWLTPTRKGEFEILCAELCGIGHFAMRGSVEVVERDQFEAWIARQPTYAELAGREPGDPEAGKQLYSNCVACHGPGGQGNKQLNAPKIAGLSSWYIVRQLQDFKSGQRGSHPEDTYGQQMRPFASMLQDRSAMADVAAYINSLPDQSASVSVAGNEKRGARIFRTCGACHGPQGQGRYPMNAPRLAGMSDWYLRRQLLNFKQGIRGDASEDFYGRQMAEMAETLVDSQQLDSVIAYINSLPRTPAERGGASATQVAQRSE